MSLDRGLPPNPANFELGGRGLYIFDRRDAMTSRLGATGVDTFCPPTVFVKLFRRICSSLVLDYM